MKIKNVGLNNHKKCFEITINKGQRYHFPYSQLEVVPTSHDLIHKVWIDKEIGNEGFTYSLKSGQEGSIHIEQVLDYNKDPEYLRELLLYKMSVHAQRLLKARQISKRELIRRMGTSPTQFYRLMNQAYYHKTIDQMVKLLAALDCSVDLVFKKAA